MISKSSRSTNDNYSRYTKKGSQFPIHNWFYQSVEQCDSNRYPKGMGFQRGRGVYPFFSGEFADRRSLSTIHDRRM